MKPLRTLAAAGVVGAATLGSCLFGELFGLSDNVAFGQTPMARTPSTLAAPHGYFTTSGYSSVPNYHATPAYTAPPAYNPAPAYAPQPTTSPYAYTAYPASGYGPAYPQAAPYLYQPTRVQLPSNNAQPASNNAQPASNYVQPTWNSVQPTWPYVQSDYGQQSVLMRGPTLAPPQVQLPTPQASYAGPPSYTPQQSAPMYQMPYHQTPTQPLPDYAPQASAAPGYLYGGGSCDAWTSGSASIVGQPAVRNWFGRVGGLVMTRDRSDHYTFSYGTLDEADQRTNTRDAAMDWTGGVDVRFGRYFNCERNAIEAVYWGLAPVTQTTQTVSGDVLGDLNGILNWNSLDYAGSWASVYVNVAPGDNGIHQLTRDYAFQNLELNLWQFCGSCDTGKCNCSRLKSNWLVGVRYFRFDENLLFASDANDVFITNENDEIFYNIDIENHLVGFQIGNEAQYCLSDRLTADLAMKLGIYGNQINHLSEIGGNLGGATINNGPWAGEAFWVSSSKNDVAFLGEVNLGLRYCFNACWTGTLGYRALAVTGVAMPADQIYPDLRGINDVANIDSSRALILHGGYAGIEYNW